MAKGGLNGACSRRHSGELTVRKIKVIGSYISKSIVEAHGGKMWGENNSDGKGVTFGFTIPISKPH